MKRLILSSTLFLAVLAAACATDSGFEPDADLVVIGAFIYSGEPVQEVRLTATLPLGSEDSTATPINDALVRLIKSGIEYELSPSLGDSGYYHYPGDDLVVATGDEFRIEVDYFGKTAWGETAVPEPPVGAKIGEGNLVIPDMSNFVPGGGFGGGGFNPFDNSLAVSWDNPTGELFFVTVENVEEDPLPIESGFRGKMLRFRSTPTTNDTFLVNRGQITHLGRHLARVYRINQEYADLYISRQQDSRDLNEPLSNIENGLGVFSAFNSDSLFFNAVME